MGGGKGGGRAKMGKEGEKKKKRFFLFSKIYLNDFTISINENKCMVRHGASNKRKYF
jgi:hypothetical protein